MNFSVNQVKQLYVVTSVKDPNVLPTDAAGSIAVKSDTNKTHVYFQYKGADTMLRSDLIDPKHIISATATNAAAMQHKKKSVTVTLDSSVNGGAPVASQDYMLRIIFRQYVGMSDEDQYFKYGVAHATAGMSASDLYKVLAMSIAKNLSREVVPLLKIELKTSSASTEVTALTKAESLTGTYTGIILTEVEQPWRLGVQSQTFVNFIVQPVSITFSGEEVLWAVITEGTNGTIGNGKKIADLEFFCMGERGDMYRQVGWPRTIHTTYLVDPSKDYHALDIHYYYVGSNEGPQKSEKTITIVCSDETELNKLIPKFNAATGQSVATI